MRTDSRTVLTPRLTLGGMDTVAMALPFRPGLADRILIV